MYKKFESIVNKVEIFIVCAGLAILIVTVFAAAVLRFFGVDMSVSTDLAQLVFAWVSFVGADMAMRQDRHMGVDLLTKRIPVKIRNVVFLLTYILVLAFLVFCVYYGINLCILNAARKYNTLYISYSWATASCPIGCGMMCITAVKNIIQYIRNIVKNDYSSLTVEEVKA